MKLFTFAAFIFLIFFSKTVFSQELEEDIINNMDACNGTWILNYKDSWTTKRLEDGTTMRIPDTAIILDCGGREGTLKEDIHNNVKATVYCAHPQTGGGHVSKIQIICE